MYSFLEIADWGLLQSTKSCAIFNDGRGQNKQATRTATSRPRLLSPRPALPRGQRRAGHASSLPGRDDSQRTLDINEVAFAREPRTVPPDPRKVARATQWTKTTKLTIHYSTVNPALPTLTRHEAETPVTPFRAAARTSTPRTLPTGTCCVNGAPLLARVLQAASIRWRALRCCGTRCEHAGDLFPWRRCHLQCERRTGHLPGRRFDEDSDEQATPPLSQAGASTRTATSKPRLLSPRPALTDAL